MTNSTNEPQSSHNREFRIIPKRLLFYSVVWQILLAAPIIVFVVMLMLGWLEEPGLGGDGGGKATKNFSQRLTILLTWVSLFSASALFSCIGSLVNSSREHGEEKDIQYGSLALSMHLLGSIFGIVLLLLFIGGFIAGSLFPDFKGVGFFRVYHGFSGVREWAKLFVWTFIAGFSERLMPDLLENFARRIRISDPVK